MMLRNLAPLLLCATAHGAIYSQYSLDGPTVADKFGLTNSDKEILLGSGDNAVCGSSYHMKANDFINLGSSNGAPTGNVDFSVGGYVKPVTLANRALFAIGGNFKDTDGSVGNWGAWVMVDSKGALSVRTLRLNQKSSATIVVGKWSQVLLTYTASETTLRLWVDGVLALSHEVTMDLRKNSRYGGMAIGEYHLGGSPWGRGGEYFMDHVSFANTVLTSAAARAPCVGIYSQYSLDGPTVTDKFGLTNSDKEILLGSGDNAVCGSSYHMKANDFITLGSSNGAPTGNVDFSVGGYVKPVTLANRALFAIGGNFKDTDGSVGNWGAWVMVDSKGALSVRTLRLNQKSSATIVVGKWSQVLLTYTASQTMLRLWVDGVLALSHEVTMDLRRNSRYGGMAIGEYHLGGSPWGRGGEYFMDHVSFANTVLTSAAARAPCVGIYSQYSLDGPTVTDKFGLTNSDKEILLGSGDNAVCGSSYHMKANDFINLGSSNGAPTGNVDFSVGGYVKPVTLANRALFAIGGNFKDTDGSVGNWGAWVMVDSKGALSVRTLRLNQKSSATIVVGKWSQVLLTYTASETTLRLWVDGVLALSHEVTMDLRKNSRYGGMAIGEYHLGGSPWGRGGEYFMDHVSFSKFVMTEKDARAPCLNAPPTSAPPTPAPATDAPATSAPPTSAPLTSAPPTAGIYSQYSLDGPTVADKFGLTNSDKEILLGSGDNAVCGSSYHMKANDFINLGSSNGAPTGNVDFSVGGYVKPVTLANRALFAIGGNFKDTDGSVGNWGAWVMVDSKGALSVRTLRLNQKSSATIVVGKWSQVLLTYTASETTLRLWVDGVLALSHEVTMDLRKNSRYGGMAIGEYHLGGSPWGRGGEYFMDQVSFSKFVMTEKDARAPCLNAPPTSAPPTPAPATSAPPASGFYSQYSLDGPTVADKFGLTNSDKEILLGSGDNAVCGSSYHMKAGDFINLGSSNGAPTGNVDFSVGGYVKPVTLANRALFAIGGNFKDTDGSVGNWGAWVMVDSKGALSVRTLKLNQKSSATIVVGKWSQVLLTYTASQTMLRLWVDGVFSLAYKVTMDLRKNSRYGGMAIGEYHLGGSPWGRGGEYFMDHVSFANTVLTEKDARAPCLKYAYTPSPPTSAPKTPAPETSAPKTSAPKTSAPKTSAPRTSAPATGAPKTAAPVTDVPAARGVYSQYSLDGPTVVDTFGLTHSSKTIALGSGDNAVCGNSYHLLAHDFINLKAGNGAPIGNVDFSVAAYVKAVATGKRGLFAIGATNGDADGSTGNWGAWVLADNAGRLSVHSMLFNKQSSATIVVGQFHQILLTYTASQTMLRLWVDGVLALSHEVTMDLRRNSKYGGMAIGEYHLGGSPFARGGEYFMDHVSFANKVLSVAEARAPCLISDVLTPTPTTAPATLTPAMTAAPGTVNVVKELLRIALGVLFSLFDADTFLADLLALLSGQVTSGNLRWTCPESACVNGCPATSALKIAAGCNSHDSSVARSAQLLASGNVVVEFEPEYAEGNSADTVKLTLDREAATPTTLAKYNVGEVDVVQGEVVIVHVDDSDDDLQAGYIVLIVAMVLLFLIVVIILIVCLVTRKNKAKDVAKGEDKDVANCPTNEVHDASV